MLLFLNSFIRFFIKPVYLIEFMYLVLCEGLVRKCTTFFILSGNYEQDTCAYVIIAS